MTLAVQSALAGAGVAMMLVYALLHLRGGRAAETVLGLLFVAGAFYMIAVWARIAGARDFAQIAAIAAAPGPWLFLAATYAYFEDRVWTWPRLAVGVAAMWALGAAVLTGIPPLTYAFDVAAGGLFLTALALAGRGWRDDLVAERRRDRAWFLVSGAGLGVAITLLSSMDSPLSRPFAAGSVLSLLTLYGARNLRVASPVAEPVRLRPSQATAPDDRLDALAARIRHGFEVERLHRQEDLSLSRLARELGAPEHHVRLAINRGLGARNFNAFVNAYRLAEVAAALAAQDQAEVPITTIALDAGFASLPTFNRAFRDAYGEAPRTFRKRSLSSSTAT